MDPDQLASKKPADLDLHCLPKQNKYGYNMVMANLLITFFYITVIISKRSRKLNACLCYFDHL